MNRYGADFHSIEYVGHLTRELYGGKRYDSFKALQESYKHDPYERKIRVWQRRFDADTKTEKDDPKGKRIAVDFEFPVEGLKGQVRFIQWVRTDRAGFDFHEKAYHWHRDAREGEEYYPFQRSAREESPKKYKYVLTRNTPNTWWMDDTPEIGLLGGTQEFLTYVEAVDGPERGQIYDWIAWQLDSGPTGYQKVSVYRKGSEIPFALPSQFEHWRRASGRE